MFPKAARMLSGRSLCLKYDDKIRTGRAIMGIAKKYVDGLKKAYYKTGGEKKWNDFEKIVHGASKEDIENLRKIYPDIPDSLLDLLETVDGTYWRKYGDEEVAFFFLGSDMAGYPYYLLSARQIADEKDEFQIWGDYLITREYGDDIPVDRGVCDDMGKVCFLHFSDCMNNGGTSQLFIDFSPSAMGKKGQVLRYLHDPDELVVVADSFDAYLQMLMDDGYDFINEDIIEE